jgi:hypothetical protein
VSESTGVTLLWRVGYHAAPLAFPPMDMYAFNHRFDDTAELRRFRTMYFADAQETCLREVLADFRPNLAARQRHIERYGPEAADDIPAEPVTAKWRRENVLVPATLKLDGELVDLFNPATRQVLEDRHQSLLVSHGMEHLDLHEITAKRRIVTQTIAGDLFEHRGTPQPAGNVVALTDPAPAALIAVTDQWNLKMQPAP